MKKKEILKTIEDKYKKLYEWLEKHPTERWDYSPEDKWTTGQHIIHLTQSAKPLNKALSLPKFFLKWKFGKPNRPGRSYDEVRHRYHEKLKDATGVSPFSQNMPLTPPENKEMQINALKNEETRYLKLIKKVSEKDLDQVLIPHPLMGRMLLREILMWSAFHVEHHLDTLKSKYQ